MKVREFIAMHKKEFRRIQRDVRAEKSSKRKKRVASLRHKRLRLQQERKLKGYEVREQAKIDKYNAYLREHGKRGKFERGLKGGLQKLKQLKKNVALGRAEQSKYRLGGGPQWGSSGGGVNWGGGKGPVLIGQKSAAHLWGAGPSRQAKPKKRKSRGNIILIRG